MPAGSTGKTMAYTRSLLQLRTSLLIRGGYERSQDITPTVANELLNDALVESYNRVVERWDDYYAQIGATFQTVVGTSSYALPTDFYHLRKVEILLSGDAADPAARWGRLFPISIDDTHRRHLLLGKNYKYWPSHGQLNVVPPPQAIETLRVYHLPLPPQLTLDTDTVQFDTPIEAKLVLQIALRDAKDRQDLPVQDAETKIVQLVDQLRAASDHDVGEPFYLGRRTDDHEDMY